jgi:predicted Zn-dependent protease with MMP-like domain
MYDPVVDLQRFQDTVQSVLDGLPEWVATEMENVAVVVEREAHVEEGAESPEILGLYEGVPLPERGTDYFGVAPDRITIFYAPHTALNLSDPELTVEIRVTDLHEVGHHLGFDDARLHELGWS